jgi:hypothetical protein
MKEAAMKTLTAAALSLVLMLSVSTPAFADGGFFKFRPDLDKDLHEPAQKAIILHKDNTETLILQVKYEGEVDEFAWVIPVPGYPNVDVAEPLLFEELAYLTYKWYPQKDRNGLFECGVIGRGGVSIPAVEVWEESTVGVYDYAILSATDPNALIDWLNSNGYAFPEDGQEIVNHYLAKQWYFIAIKITAGAEAEELDEGTIQPLKLYFVSNDIVYPLKISSLSSDLCEVLLYVFAEEKAVPAEYAFLNLTTGEQIEYFSRKDSVFYIEYENNVYLDVRELPHRSDEWEETYNREHEYYNYYEKIYYYLAYLLAGEEYYLTKMRADVTADSMVDINLVAYDEQDFPDTDGDGWSDVEEKVAGTNPHRVDTDYDGIVDSEDVSPTDIPYWALVLIVVFSLGILFALWLWYRRRLLSRVPHFKSPE